MQAKELSVFDFLNSAKKITAENNHRDFCFGMEDAVSFYDIFKNGDFLGIFTLKEVKPDEYVLIDGYSRLLLFSLLICAVCNNNIEYEDFIKHLHQKEPKSLKIEFLNSDNDFYRAVSTNYFE